MTPETLIAIKREERFVDHEGGRLRYVVVGEGPPLVLAHGWNGSAENFETWYEDVGAMRTLLIPDLPGCGLSSRLPGKHDADALSWALDTVVRDFGVERFDLGGLCVGASVAMALYRRRPEAVDKLIIHTPLIAPRLIHPQFRRHVRIAVSPPVFPLLMFLGRQRWWSDWYKRVFSQGEVEDDTGAEINFLNQKRVSAFASRQWIMDAMRRDDVDLVRSRQDPTLILLAGDDRLAEIPAIEHLVADLPNVLLATFDDAGHGWSADFVARQNSVVVSFLEGSDPPDTARLRTALRIEARE